MTDDQLRQLTRATEPLSALSAALDGRVPISYSDIVFCLLERLDRARNDLLPGRSVASELEQELRRLADTLPPVRRRAETAPQDESGDDAQ